MRLRKLAAMLFLLFCGLVVGRFLVSYGWERESPDQPTAVPASGYSGSLSFWSKSYRMDCANNLKSISLPLSSVPETEAVLPAGAQLAALEVYTREARVGTTTSHFDDDVAASLAVVEEHGAVIRLEATEGVAPYRNFRVVLRVPVDKLDACVADLREIGELQTYSVTKEDKTEEVRQRFAERDALRAYADSLGKLRQVEGKVSEMLKLEAKIQEIERQIQTLSAGLGEYVKKESYNNVNYSLAERELLDIPSKDYPVAARLAAAVVWATQWEATLVGVLALAWLVRASARTLAAGEPAV